jgi:hypothetical protein
MDSSTVFRFSLQLVFPGQSYRPTTFIAHLTGSHGVLLSRDLHRGDEPQDSGSGLRSPSGQLPQEHVEHHGLCRRGHRVGYLFPISSLFA